MLRSIGASYAIIGPRGDSFQETDETVNKRLLAALRGSSLIVCVGETLEQREAGKTFAVMTQVKGSQASTDRASSLVVAYEPVWAIGTGKTARNPGIHSFIRGLLKDLFGDETAGLVESSTAASRATISIRSWPTDIDGALVGGASLDAAFERIIRFKGQ